MHAKQKSSSHPDRPPSQAVLIDDLRALLTIQDSPVSLLAVKEVARRTSLSKGQIYHLMSRGEFPKTASLSEGGGRGWMPKSTTGSKTVLRSGMLGWGT
ncbi:MAG: AlpA family phage regulatory protein [Proteobacteria bacterium]|nr:AlpA family phage regulatory protein [Pseudomonadota bacterium]